MAEYKELERSLLARMFRAGVIDAATFTKRVEALGFSPEDTFLMLKLEEREAVKFTLWSGYLQPALTELAPTEKVTTESPELDVEFVVYISIRGRIRYSPGGESILEMVWYDANGTEIARSELGRFTQLESFTLTVSRPELAVKAKLLEHITSTHFETAKFYSAEVTIEAVKY